MKKLPQPLSDLIDVMERLPGIGPKTASRLAYYLFQTPKKFVDDFADSLVGIKEKLRVCSVCHNVDEVDPCRICSDGSRDEKVVCVVERPLDILAVEETGKFNGRYHVLGGVINPLLHIGPDDLFIDSLIKRTQDEKIKEIILATNPTMEGEATALFIRKALKRARENIMVSRIGHGLPMGADLDYADPGTLSEALSGRREF